MQMLKLKYYLLVLKVLKGFIRKEFFLLFTLNWIKLFFRKRQNIGLFSVDDKDEKMYYLGNSFLHIFCVFVLKFVFKCTR